MFVNIFDEGTLGSRVSQIFCYHPVRVFSKENVFSGICAIEYFASTSYSEKEI